MDHRERIKAIVMEVLHSERHEGWPSDPAVAWTEVRRLLRGLSDTSTTLREDERTALQILRQL